MKEGPPRWHARPCDRRARSRRPVFMLHAGLDLSRRRLDVCLIDDDGEAVGRLAAAPDADGLRQLVERVGPRGRVRGVIESMTGARFVRDTLEELGWEVLVADAQKVKGLAPLACRPTRSTRACWRCSRTAIWCRRSGCPTRASAANASSRASGCTWSATARRSR